jgi:very-short-patch-repair endonuclease
MARGRYIVDFASHTAKVVIEVDGGQHQERSAVDAAREVFGVAGLSCSALLE